ncbi:hypothetical protein [uncultured Flavobacterium sp.]|uniref:hypothetical protein n=1 Tax=uncultured Flavobacterium sp. TaxID=165435 RepID=UPI00292EDF9B|nr:hypothetical protein [uncultured Flavobacterium sp.]
MFTNFYSQAAFSAAAHGTFQGTMTAVSGGKFFSGFAAGALSSIAASAWSGGSSMTEAGKNGRAIPNTGMSGIGGNFADSGLGMIAFGTVSGGVGAQLTGGNFWQGAATGLVVSGLNHFVHEIQVKNEIESKYPGLYKTLSKLKSYVKDHSSILETLSLYSGYSNKEVLNQLSLHKLANIVKLGGTDEVGQFFSNVDPENVHIDKIKAASIDTAGYRSRALQISETVNGTSFFVGMTVLHEMVHYMRYWNNLPSLFNGEEAGRMFEQRVFGQILNIKGSSKMSIMYDWKF